MRLGGLRLIGLAALMVAGLAGGAARAQAPDPSMLVADPAPAYRGEAIPLGAAGGASSEQWNRVFGQTWVRNVTQPVLYPVRPPAGRANGTTVIVVPGGGYKFVSIESEGFRVAERLAADGVTAFVLKYRPLPTPPDPKAFMAELAAEFSTLGKGELVDDPAAVDDLAAAVRLVRERATGWGLKPERIGVIGFSAGARTAIRFLEGKPEAADLVHVALIYPPMTRAVAGGPRPPLFLAIAADDPLFRQGGLTLPQGWLAQSPDMEFHLYSGGSHGFGMIPRGATSDGWIDNYLAWLAAR